MEASLSELRSLVTLGIVLLVLTLLKGLGAFAAGVFNLLGKSGKISYCAV